MSDESMPGLEASVELVNLGIWVQKAWDLSRQYRAGTISRTQGHRLIETLHLISEVTGTPPHDLWLEYVGEET